MICCIHRNQCNKTHTQKMVKSYHSVFVSSVNRLPKANASCFCSVCFSIRILWLSEKKIEQSDQKNRLADVAISSLLHSVHHFDWHKWNETFVMHWKIVSTIFVSIVFTVCFFLDFILRFGQRARVQMEVERAHTIWSPVVIFQSSQIKWNEKQTTKCNEKLHITEWPHDSNAIFVSFSSFFL